MVQRVEMASGGRIHQLIKQARATFTRTANDITFRQEFEKLKAAVRSDVIDTKVSLYKSPPIPCSHQMACVTPEDFNLTFSTFSKAWDYSPYVKDAPASCMDVYECSEFSMSIFMMKPNKSMPLHDHPEMHGSM